MKRVLITGAARRIGAQIARTLASDGWHVAIHFGASRENAEAVAAEITAQGGHAVTVRADLSQPGSPQRLIDEATAALGPLDALINNASLFEYDALDTLSEAALDRHFAVNARAPVMLSKAFAQTIGPGREGCVINLLDNKVFAPNPDYFSYTISKLALHGATPLLTLALAPRVRVNAIAPGITLISGEQSQANFERGHTLNPLGKGCTPDQIARTVQYILATPALNGAVITIDGGQSIANPGRDVAFIAPG